MSPGIRLVPGRDRRRGIRNGGRTDHKILDSTTTDTVTSAEDWIHREVPRLSMTALEVHHQVQELAHQRHLDLVVEAHHQDQSLESCEMHHLLELTAHSENVSLTVGQDLRLQGLVHL